ncbi:docking protein 2 [Numida meleagris]|uniref:docking protein 2 n=1 Tax=Numida meleagris TaxID=8996 RepID=UPI000B3DBD1E|nr:docking protein 2 [Numida meleagris]
MHCGALHTRRAAFPACTDRCSAAHARRAAFPTCTMSSTATDPPHGAACSRPTSPTHPCAFPCSAMHQGTVQHGPVQDERQHHAADGPCAPSHPNPSNPPLSAGPHSPLSSRSGPRVQLCTRLPFVVTARRQEAEHGEETAAPDRTSRGVSAHGALGTLGDGGAAQVDAPGCRMEEAVVKQGVLHLQLQQTFGKKWKKYWGVLYRETPCSTARLELFEGADKPRKGEGSRRLVKMSDCVHVAEAGGEVGCPRATAPFLLETTEKRYLLAAEGGEVEGWVRRLCQLAFPTEVGEHQVQPTHPHRAPLTASPSSALSLRDDAVPFLQVTFSFEAGRRCASGEGNFEFETRQGNEIFQVIESAIAVQRQRGGPGDEGTRPRQQNQLPERAPEQEEQRAKSIYTEPCNSLLRASPSAVPKAPEKGRKKDAAGELEYAVPFDTIAKSLMVGKFGSILHGPADAPDPLYDSIQEAGGHRPLPRTRAKPEHIYDEPEGVCIHSVYDEPQEVKGEAWRLQAAPEEPAGHEYPYNPQRDDYAVPKRAVPLRQGKEWLGDTEYDNVVFQLAKKRNKQ